MIPLSRTERVAVGVAAALAGGVGVALLVGVPVVSTPGGTETMGGPGPMGGPGTTGGPGFPFVFFPLAFLTFAALFVLGTVGVRALTGSEATDQSDDDETVDPVTRIQRRYTDGELTETEFERALERELAGEEFDRGVEGQTDVENRRNVENQTNVENSTNPDGTTAERSASTRER